MSCYQLCEGFLQKFKGLNWIWQQTTIFLTQGHRNEHLENILKYKIFAHIDLFSFLKNLSNFIMYFGNSKIIDFLLAHPIAFETATDKISFFMSLLIL